MLNIFSRRQIWTSQTGSKVKYIDCLSLKTQKNDGSFLNHIIVGVTLKNWHLYIIFHRRAQQSKSCFSTHRPIDFLMGFKLKETEFYSLSPIQWFVLIQGLFCPSCDLWLLSATKLGTRCNKEAQTHLRSLHSCLQDIIMHQNKLNAVPDFPCHVSK